MRSAQPGHSLLSLALAVVIGAIGGCATAPSQSASPISATSVPATSGAATPTTGPTAQPTPNPSPTGSAPPSSSALEISGTFESSSDVTNDDGAHVIHTVIHQTGTVTAMGAADGTLTGSASYVYRKDYKFVGEGCAKEWTTGDVAWDVAVSGTWQVQADSSIAIVLTPATSAGPGIPEDLMCLGDLPEYPLAWPFAGTLVNGSFDSHTDLIPVGSSGSDFSWIEEHLQRA